VATVKELLIKIGVLDDTATGAAAATRNLDALRDRYESRKFRRDRFQEFRAQESLRERFEDSMRDINALGPIAKAVIAIKGIEGSLRLATAAAHAFRGELSSAREALFQIPLVGGLIRTEFELLDVLSGRAAKEKEIAMMLANQEYSVRQQSALLNELMATGRLRQQLEFDNRTALLSEEDKARERSKADIEAARIRTKGLKEDAIHEGRPDLATAFDQEFGRFQYERILQADREIFAAREEHARKLGRIADERRRRDDESDARQLERFAEAERHKAELQEEFGVKRLRFEGRELEAQLQEIRNAYGRKILEAGIGGDATILKKT
jgi:hypothetical protein